VSTYEEEIRQALKVELDSGCLKEVGPTEHIFGLLIKAYPFRGSKIDWKRVPGTIGCTTGDRSNQSARFAAFFDEMCSRFRLNGPVVYIGDSATDFALAGSIKTMRRVLSVLIDTPQHHYLVGPNASWCICLTMEGDIDFGSAVVSPFH
jgi:hypothetical protein